jgi:hypothetical protein
MSGALVATGTACALLTGAGIASIRIWSSKT